jgi:hypothetical protein
VSPQQKTYDQVCEEADDRRREISGWTSMAWVGVNFAEPRDEHEKWALAKVQEVLPEVISISIYKVVDLLAQVRRANR